MEDFNFKKREHFWSLLTCTCSSSVFPPICSLIADYPGPATSARTSPPPLCSCFGSGPPPFPLSHTHSALISARNCSWTLWFRFLAIDCFRLEVFLPLQLEPALRNMVLAFFPRSLRVVFRLLVWHSFHFPCSLHLDQTEPFALPASLREWWCYYRV